MEHEELEKHEEHEEQGLEELVVIEEIEEIDGKLEMYNDDDDDSDLDDEWDDDDSNWEEKQQSNERKDEILAKINSGVPELDLEVKYFKKFSIFFIHKYHMNFIKYIERNWV